MINEELLNKLARFCSYSERCEYDVYLKAQKLNIPSDDIQAYIEWLTHEQFIDHSRYIRAYVNDKIIFSKWGLNKIQHELSAKRIHANVQALYREHTEWHEPYKQNIAQLIQSKLRRLKPELSDYEKKQKIHAYLYQRGFDSNEYTLNLTL